MRARIIYQILLFFFFQSTSLMYNSYATTITRVVTQKKQHGKNVTSSKKSSTAKKNVNNKSKSDIYISDKPSDRYINWKNDLIDKGFHLNVLDYADLAQGESAEFTPRLCADLKYAIIALPDDNNVQDVNIYIFSRDDGRLYDYDDSDGRNAVINYENSSPEEMRIVIKNNKSNIPNQKFRIRLIVAYLKTWNDWD